MLGTGKVVLRCVLAVTLISYALAAQAAVTIDLVPVGNPGNAADSTGYGSVNYVYQMGKYEVTNAQYREFLANKAVTDTYGLYYESMSSDARGGINRSGSSGSYSYTVKLGYENMPVTFVSWYDAIRFANWLQNGQGSGSTENGTYTITNGGYNSGTVAVPDAAARASWTNPHWVLPSENEWYKAAYHQPSTQGGDTDNYWTYATRTNSLPYSTQPPGSNAPVQANTANYFGYNGYAVTGSGSFDNNVNYLTNVGAYTQSASFYGTFDQNGNVWEWNETVISSDLRGIRGGSWFSPPGDVESSRAWTTASSGDYDTGFRVAFIPEPGSLVMLAGLAVMILLSLWRKGARR